ncbi:glycerol-3-phosphate dehydrogenase/oxidase [Leeuwenhoekiella parthenopeia]|uniref:Glycerol-3-phosphate dehydrogenase/oxidase n=1 Tax=Leeuwenhoekiella parthenopeia TaxID=2890320 RepID=A0ABS8GSG9_9FLAO|nr:glycerol-3-phosphate dehydrogenase/oxidase [Leeuwenhoekiella parthenopeia]MCC4212942.1 glycerol-3-phosphate dehydrogenase/oxidase [Leeuwenhoekiella parthenopeia]
MKTNIFNREQLISQLPGVKKWDVIVIGGGASGLGVAVDSATRGYKTLLLEQVDYAKGTSSRSTKLVHGGVRYLAQGNIDLVREALHERGLLEKNAPHLVKNQSFVIPNYRWWEGIYYTIGLKAYDFLAGKLSLGKSTHINKTNTVERLSTLRQKGLYGGVVYKDGQFDDSRLAVNLAQTAIEQGATLLNHFKVTDLAQDTSGKITGVEALDAETNTSYSFDANLVINATGVFSDEILKMQNKDARKSIVPSQGVHLVFDKSFLPGEDAIMIPKTDDGRVLFAVPWHDKVIVGTTDTNLDDHSLEPQAQEQEIEFILQTFNNYLDKKVTRADVRSIYAGLRPLAAPKDSSEKTKEISRSHKVIVSESGLLTITGGKWTTYRRMAQDTIDKAISLKRLPKQPCRTKDLKIHGAKPTEDRNDHKYIYGTDQKGIADLIKEDASLGEKLHPRLPFLKAEVVWAARYEMARTVDDVLARRVRALFLDAHAAIDMTPEVAQILAKELNRDEAWRIEQVDKFTKLANHYCIESNTVTA